MGEQDDRRIVGHLSHRSLEIVEAEHMRAAPLPAGQQRQLIFEACEPKAAAILFEPNGAVAIDRDSDIGESPVSECFHPAVLLGGAVLPPIVVAHDRQQNLAEREAEAKTLQQVVEALDEGLHHLANGDLAYQIDTRFPNELESLRVNFNEALATLSETMVTTSGIVAGLYQPL